MALIVLLLSPAAPAHSDEFRPAYFQLTQTARDTYDVLWKLPAIDESTPLRLAPRFPEGSQALTEMRGTYAQGTLVRRWRVRVPGGLEGKDIAFSHLSQVRVDVLARLVRLDGSVQIERILPVNPRFVARASPGSFEVVGTYGVLGIEHILTGFDHLLFVFALVLLVEGRRRLLVTITAFTVAHSITLAGATLGWVQIDGPPVEASIALSIVFVASEILHARQGRSSLTQRQPWLVALAFGLLHGFGFAGALAQFGLPQSSVPVALLCFNIGVELGQLLFVVVVCTLIGCGTRVAKWLHLPRPAWTSRIAPYAIGGLASFWLIERIAAF